MAYEYRGMPNDPTRPKGPPTFFDIFKRLLTRKQSNRNIFAPVAQDATAVATGPSSLEVARSAPRGTIGALPPKIQTMVDIFDRLPGQVKDPWPIQKVLSAIIGIEPGSMDPDAAIAMLIDQPNLAGKVTKVVDAVTGAPKTVFHGTSSRFMDFDAQKLDKGALYGPGFYWTESPEIAGGSKEVTGYAFKQRGDRIDPAFAIADLPTLRRQRLEEAEYAKKQISHIDRALAYPHISDERKQLLQKTKASWEKAYQSRLDDIDRIQADVDELLDLMEREPDKFVLPNVRPARLNIQNPLDLEAPITDDISSALDGSADNPIEKIYLKGKEMYPDYDWDEGIEMLKDATDGPNTVRYAEAYQVLAKSEHETSNARLGKDRLNEVIKAAGFDGLTHIGGGRRGADAQHRVWIAFDREQIRSPWGPAETAPQWGFGTLEALLGIGAAGAAGATIFGTQKKKSSSRKEP